jgi:hypothetical protein
VFPTEKRAEEGANCSAHFGRCILNVWRCASLQNSTGRSPVWMFYFLWSQWSTQAFNSLLTLQILISDIVFPIRFYSIFDIFRYVNLTVLPSSHIFHKVLIGQIGFVRKNDVIVFYSEGKRLKRIVSLFLLSFFYFIEKIWGWGLFFILMPFLELKFFL